MIIVLGGFVFGHQHKFIANKLDPFMGACVDAFGQSLLFTVTNVGSVG